MARLRELATLIRSKNAGPFLLTLDLIFDRRDTYDQIVRSGVLDAEAIARLYNVPSHQVQFFLCPEIMAIKATIPRLVGAGDPLDSDVYGAQQIGPVLDLEIPISGARIEGLGSC